MSWKENLNFGEPTYIEHTVGSGDKAKAMKFYPVSVGAMFKLRDLLSPLGKAIATLTADTSKDGGRIIRDIGEPFMFNGKPYTIEGPDKTKNLVRDAETIFEAITPSLAQLRDEQKSAAIQGLINAIMEEKNAMTVSEIIMDSLRLRGTNKPPAQEFLTEIPFPVFCDFLVGVAKANKGVFEPMGKMMAPALDRIKANAALKLDGLGRTQSEQPSQTDGESSQTPS